MIAAACSGNGKTTSSGSGGTTTNASSGSGASTSASTTSTGAGSTCGNGTVEGNEECDDGPKNGTAGDPCRNDCSWVCIAGNPTRDHCYDGNPCPGMATCGADHKCAPGTPLMSGAMCAAGKYCVNSNCVSPTCGDGVVEPGEECDDGNTTNGDGCDSNCKFSCLATDPTRNCASTNPCIANGTCGTNHVCTAGSNVANGTACGTGKVCQAGVCTVVTCAGQAKCTACMGGFCDGTTALCQASKCGDGCVDAAAGEQCEPPNTASCDASCHTVSQCGNGVIDPGEQCDDGNRFNLDGCDSNCKYEAVARMTKMAIASSAAPSFCTPTTNAIGTQVFTPTALGQVNPGLQKSIDAGTTNIMTQFLGLTDLTGVSSPTVNIGVLTGAVDPAKGAPMNSPIDWWFFAQSSQVDSMGLPKGVLGSGVVSARNLTAGPSDVTLQLLLAGTPAALEMRSARVAAAFDGTPAPNVPAPPPAALAAGLTVFQTITGSGANQGLCGNITVGSLAKIPVPAALSSTGSNACSQNYIDCGGQPVSASCNSLLDVIVNGCSVFGGFISVVNATQPDVPATSGGTIQQLSDDMSAGAISNKVPSSQTDNDNDAYSAFLTFTANRAHFTGETCAMTSDCQAGKTCTGGKCQ